MSKKIEKLDVRETVCGLMPALKAHLEMTDADEVEFMIRPGIAEEIISGFGTGGNWKLTFKPDLGHDFVCFTRREHKTPANLNILTY